jgi:arginase family enzyme
VDESSQPKGILHNILVHFGIRDEDPEEVSEQEKARKAKIAAEGWKKVKKVVNLIKFQGY